MLVDSHCHLDFPDFAEDFNGVLARARGKGVVVMQTISTRLSTHEQVLAVAARDPDIWCSVGLHPHNVSEEMDFSCERIVKLADHSDVIGIGETGLDYHYENNPRERQQESFRQHIRASRETGLPLIVHTRDADEDTIAILEEEHARGAFPGLIHCFTAGPELAKAALRLGFAISISGIVTFRNAGSVQQAAREIPLKNILIETDSPFLAPVPNRGKRCEPAYVTHTAECIAGLRGIPLEHLAQATTDNFFKLFTEAKRPAGA